MSKIGIYFGSSTGNTQDAAETIASQLGVSSSDIHDVSSAKADFSNYDVLLFGSSTWGLGDLQDDWEGFIGKASSADLNGKKVAIFGCGDSASYSDTFCDAIGKIYQAVERKGCAIIGRVSDDGYSYSSSEAFVDGKFVGLPLDADNESDKTNERISAWVSQIKGEI
ncbi:MAG: flavodoxin FldA [Prevotellaceae bacterium]|jgi:flavodoxin I|nr:flavodoxin FldA [Prevotellaceae bacterium]